MIRPIQRMRNFLRHGALCKLSISTAVSCISHIVLRPMANFFNLIFDFYYYYFIRQFEKLNPMGIYNFTRLAKI